MRGSGRARRYCARECRTSVSSPNVLGCPVGMSVGQPSGPINKMVIPNDYSTSALGEEPTFGQAAHHGCHPAWKILYCFY